MRRAVEGLQLTPQHFLIDAKRLKEIAIPQQAIIKATPNPPASRLLPFSQRSRAMR
jgi:ribonuclease HII